MEEEKKNEKNYYSDVKKRYSDVKKRYKRKRKSGGGSVGVDRISELPNCIIHHILGFLTSSKDVTRTSVLSKQWYRDIWASLPFLIFSEKDLITIKELEEALSEAERCDSIETGLKHTKLWRNKFREHIERSLRSEIKKIKFNYCFYPPNVIPDDEDEAEAEAEHLNSIPKPQQSFPTNSRVGYLL